MSVYVLEVTKRRSTLDRVFRTTGYMCFTVNYNKITIFPCLASMCLLFVYICTYMYV